MVDHPYKHSHHDHHQHDDDDGEGGEEENRTGNTGSTRDDEYDVADTEGENNGGESYYGKPMVHKNTPTARPSSSQDSSLGEVLDAMGEPVTLPGEDVVEYARKHKGKGYDQRPFSGLTILLTGTLQCARWENEMIK